MERVCITNMNVEKADFKRLPELYDEVVWKLGKIEADINYCKKI